MIHNYTSVDPKYYFRVIQEDDQGNQDNQMDNQQQI